MADLEFDKLIKRKATQWAKKLTTLAKNNAPKHIAPHIYSTSSAGEGRAQITLGVRRVETFNELGAVGNYGTTDAYAQEYGVDHEYPITPRPGKYYLSFPWEKADPTTGRVLPNGEVLMKSVTHKPFPPYRGKGFLHPAVEEWRAQLEGTESKEIAQAIMADIKKDFLAARGKRLFVE